MPSQHEKILVEDYMLEKLKEKGWKYLPGKELGRDNYEEPLLIDNLIDSIKRINSIKLDNEDIEEILKQLKLRGTGVEDCKKILNFFKFGVSTKLSKSKELVRVKLFDYENLENNEFIVSNQVRYESTSAEIIPDIVLYVNGIPLVIIECKDLTSSSISWKNAYRDIVHDYRLKVREPFKYFQIGIAAEQKAKYFPIVPWAEDVGTHEWIQKGKEELGKDLSMSSIFEMLDKKTLMDLIKDFIFVREERSNTTKVIARYMQYGAVSKIANRVKSNILEGDKKNKGLIWHWQGSGKTLTMAFAAQKLYYQRFLENPTIFFIVDRTDLEDQIYQEVNALDMPRVESIASIRELKKVLQHDGGKGKRGLFTILIHKFRPGDFEDFRKEIEKLSKNQQTFLTRKNIIAFIDESHRTQYGLLAAQMKSILKNAFFFAFTGTPISKKYQDTYNEFAYPPEEPYLDKYFIKDAIRDGFTLKITYQPRLENLHLKRDVLELLLEVEDESLEEKKREKAKEDIKKKINIRNAYYKNVERIKKISRDIAKHFKGNLDGKFKAMVVAVDREACVQYKKELDQLLPGYCEIVMTLNSNEKSKILRNYYEEIHKKYPNKEISEIMKEITNKFKEEDKPKILIVTDMLLTGFDAPILQTMYLDKPLREHRLLQAIARTNRPFKDVKEAGLIIDYLGILKEFKKAFDIYSKNDIQGALYNIEEIKKEFKEKLKETLEIFKDFERVLDSRVYLYKIIQYLLSNPEKLRKFTENIKELRKQFELLGSDPSKMEYYKDLGWLERIYEVYLSEVTPEEESKDEAYLKKYFSKTLSYIHKSTQIKKLKESLPRIEFNEDYIKKLEEKNLSKEEKAANIVFTLNRYILVDRDKDRLYESLIEKVERLFNNWKKETKNFEKIYKEGVQLFRMKLQIDKRQKELNLNNFEFSTLLALERKIGKEEGLISDVKNLFEKLHPRLFTNWASQYTTRREVQRMIRMFLLGYLKKYNLSLEDIDNLGVKIFDNLRKYEKRG